jgi:hypothetical protein
MSVSEVHGAAKRLQVAGLLNRQSRRPNKVACREFILHGLRYVFPASPGPIVPGILTSYAAPPLKGLIVFDPREAPVMPLAEGPARGPEIEPLYRSAPKAATHDEKLYEMLALVDALRSGRARERNLAARAIGERLE